MKDDGSTLIMSDGRRKRMKDEGGRMTSTPVMGDETSA